MLRFLMTISFLLASHSLGLAATGPLFAHAGYFQDRTGFCAADSRLAALDCARKQCADKGGTGIECRNVRSCATSGWAFELLTTHRSGASWQEFHCGFVSQPGALKVLTMICSLRHEATSCRITRLISPDGRDLPLK